MKSVLKRVLSLILVVCMMTSSVGDLGLFAEAALDVFRLSTRLRATDGATYEVTVRCAADSGIPRSAVLKVESLADGGEYVEQSMALAGVQADELELSRTFDITILDPVTGEAYQPDRSVQVSIRLLDANLGRSSDISVVHFGEAEAETMDANVRSGRVVFAADGFSVYVLLAYTVDFHWEDCAYSIRGGSELRLSALLQTLGVTELTTADVASVRFSNPAYLAIERTGTDWLLRSLAPFDTEETLTLALRNGQTAEIRVTDAQKTVTSENYGTVFSGVSDGDELALSEDLHITSALSIQLWNSVSGITFDLGGHTLTIDGGLDFQSNGTLALRNGTLAGSVNLSNGSPTIELGDSMTVNGAVTVSNGTIRIDGGTINGSVSTGNGPSFTLLSGTVTGDVTVTGGGTAQISGGTINGSVSTNSGASLAVTGGTVTGSVTTTDGGTQTISGGTIGGAVSITYPTRTEISGGEFQSTVSVTSGTEPTITGGSFTDPPTVNGAPVYLASTIKAEPTAVTGLSYNGAAQALVTPGTVENGVMVYSLTADGDYTADIPAETNAGDYTVYYKAEGQSAPAGSLVASIARAEATVTADDLSKIKGESDPALTATVTGLFGGDTVSFTLARVEGEAAGSYVIAAMGEAAQGNYAVRYVNGTFTIRQKTLTITAASVTKEYDGYVLSSHDFTAVGLAAGDTIQSVVTEGSQTDVGSGPNAVRDALILNADGEDVTGTYEITYFPGTLTVTKKPITITADSAERPYDGTALTVDSYSVIGLADGDVLDSVTVAGSQTLAGESANVPSNAVIVRPTDDNQIVDVTELNYTITYEIGTLRVTQRELTITADSAKKTYDGAALTDAGYAVTGLAEGDSLQTVTVTGSQTDAGTSENIPSAATIVNANGEDVTGSYHITYASGALEVTKKAVRLTANSGLQVADGTEKTVSGFTVSANGWQLSGVTFDGVSASGFGTEVGSYPVTFFGVTPGETTDTTGNYIVTETENGTLRVTAGAPITKSHTFFGNEAHYTITVNPEGLTLNGGNDLTLKDTFSKTQSIDYGSITRSDSRVSYDYNDRTGTFVIPDGTSVTISYKTRVSGAAGTNVAFDNTVQLGVTQYGSFAGWCEASVNTAGTITPSGVDIDGTDGVYTIRLFTYPQNHMERGLGGAVFRLLDANHRPIVYRSGEQAGSIVTFTTGDNGYATVSLDDGVVSLHKNTLYYLEMVTAPVGNEGGHYTYYQKDDTLYSFLITDNPNYNADGYYSYFNGDVLKVRCYPESAGINVTKRFSGNYDLPDAQKNRVRFILQKEDLASESWVDVETHTYAEFTYGTMNFSTGRAGGPPMEQAVLYRVIEEYDNIEGVDQTSSVTLTYQRDHVTVQENSNEFAMNPDHDTYSFSLMFDNTYVDHRLTLVKMNELTGDHLPGAEFTVYKALDNSAVKTYSTDENGTLVIRRSIVGEDYAADTAYYVVETKAPDGYLMPKNPEKLYFYFSEASAGVPEGIPVGMTAVDLSSTFDTVIVANQSTTVTVPVILSWDVDGSRVWPATVGDVMVSLYQSVNGGAPEPVLRNSVPMTVTLNSGKSFDNTTFVDLPARDAHGNDIVYSVAQEPLPDYYTSYKVSGTGWYVVKNEAAVSVTVEKKWYDLGGNPVSGSGSVAFDLYRTTADHPEITTRAALETLLRGETPVRTNLTLSADNGWTNTVHSLQKQNAGGQPYYYFALEREDSMPRNNEDSYGIVPASGEAVRKLTIHNTQTPVTVIIHAGDLEKQYGHDDPAFTFTTEVQEDGCTVSEPVPNGDGGYTVSVTRGAEIKSITFTCSREIGEGVGSYAILPTGDVLQEGYRVRFDDGALTITPAQVTVKGTATKVYGDPDPSLVEITGLKEGDSIVYYAYRDIGEQKGSYRVTVTGLAKQGNYDITYLNDYLTIEPAPVTVTADNVTRAFGQNDPTLTVSIDGLKNHDARSVIKYQISRAEGESVGEYPITVTGAEAQGNYTVTYQPGTFTIRGQKVTVRAKNLAKTYGSPDPVWQTEVTGLKPGDTLAYSFSREPGEDVGTYVITPAGAAAQGNYEVTYETGLLTINRANLIVTPNNIVKALTDPLTPDPQLTVRFDTLVNGDDAIVPTADYDGSKWFYTYTREGKTEPEFGFTLTRTPGETAGPYIIAASAYGERAHNYNITYKTGIFTILTTYGVTLTQHTRDQVNGANNPAYAYTAVLDMSAIGIGSYNADGFTDGSMSFALPVGGESSRVLPIPSGATLTLTQQTENPDYTTSIALDGNPTAGTSVTISPVSKAAAIDVTHTRICLPAQARAALRQTAGGAADETDAVAVTPLAYLGIPRDGDGVPGFQSADGEGGFIRALDAQGVYNLPENMYYVPEHASVYNGETAVAANVQAICYLGAERGWQYSLDGESFTPFAQGETLVLFYMPKFVCRVQADEQPFYTLNEALTHIRTMYSGTGVIELLLASYNMPSADALSVAAEETVTLTTAAELVETATIMRKANFTAGHMIRNSGTLTLGRITLDGNGDRVTSSDAMLQSNGTLTVSGSATLRNANANEGGALYVNGGAATVEAGASLTGNHAAKGGAVYFNNGSLTLATDNISGNHASYGGAVYVGSSAENKHTLTFTGTISGNSASNGGAVYLENGTFSAAGVISGNHAEYYGGAVVINKGTFNLIGGTIENNNAIRGGVFYLNGGTVNMTGGTVRNNTAQLEGGMCFVSNSTVTVTGGSILNNAATEGNGGAILMAPSGTVSLGGATVQGNSAANGNGGVVYQMPMSGKLTVTGTLNGANTAQNGAAVYVEAGSATFDGCTITGNVATAGGAIGVGSDEARLHFAGDAKVTDNTWNSAASNVYLDRDTDLVINTAGLGGSANIGVRVAEAYLATRGDAACRFGTYTKTDNLSGFKNDVRTGLTACENNYKIIWSKGISVSVRRLESYGAGFPAVADGTQITGFTYYPKSQTNGIYDLVMEMYNAKYKSSITGNDLYAYSFATTATQFEQFLSDINWDSVNQRWSFLDRGGSAAPGNPSLRVYYSQGAYLSIVNNSAYDLTVNTMTVLGKSVPYYGYPTVKNNITLETLTPVTADDLVLKSGENIKLLFPGAVNQSWTLAGTFTDPTTHEPVSGAAYAYTLDRTHGGTEQNGAADANGSFTFTGKKTNGTAGGSYEILFGNPTNICKVTDSGGVEHPFAKLNDAWNYIVDNGLTYNGTATPGGTIEMLIDYLQPVSDVLTINESSFTGRGKSYTGYRLALTTAATEGVSYPYVGQPGVTRATISRDSDNDGAAVIAMPHKKAKAATEAECDAFLIVDNLTFDGKALAKKGNGGAISTANNVVTITNCDFKGYQAVRGGAVFVAWGALTVGGDDPTKRCTFSNCSTGASSGDKIGGGGIWTSAQNLVVKNADFDTCACIIGNSQGGGIFHNIRKNGKSIFEGDGSGDYAQFPNGYSLTTTTLIEGCTFKNCYSAAGSGGTIECDSMAVTIKGCSFNGSYSNKTNANGGAVNILHDDSFGEKTVYLDSSLTVIDTTFKNCQTNTGSSYGGAICDQNSVTTEIVNCYFLNCSSNTGGAVVTNRAGVVPIDATEELPDGITVSILGSRFENCTARGEGGAVHTTTRKLTISDTYTDDNGQSLTADAWFKDCSAPKYGGVYQNGIVTGSEVTVSNAYFNGCKSATNNAGALMVNAQTLSISGTTRTNESDLYTFMNCTAGSSGGAVYHSPKTTVQDTLTDVSFYNCKAGAEGGGARLASTAIEISGAEVRSCEAVTNGGGLYVQGASTLTDCVFSGNKATGETGYGGSLFVNSGTVTITGGSVSDSVAANGGGIYNKGTLTVSKEASEGSGTITNCAAKSSGGGIYTTNAATLNGATISDCYAVVSGGGIYHTSTLNLYGTITRCCAGQGGGLYSSGVLTMTDTTKTAEISDCHAATVTVAANGTTTVVKEYKPEQLGGGVYKSGGNKWDLKSATATISGCSAYDGGGVYYNSTGTLTYSAGNFYANTAANNGGAIYKNAGTITISGSGVIGGSAEHANRAQYGAGIFVADGQSITIGGGRITHNVGAVGGAVAVGGNNANTQLLFQGATVIRGNTNANGDKCNVYLNYDTNGIIRTSGTALSAGAYIGVYVSDEQFDRHGDYGMPFGTFNKADNLASFFNDRIYAGGKRGSSNNQIVWGKFVCKITDGNGNLLYTDSACEAPAVYMTLENNSAANTTSAFGMVSNSAPNLYHAGGKYSGAYQIQMLVGDYSCTSQIKIANGPKDITLTTASKTADECGFCYTGAADQAVVRRGADYISMIDTTNMSKLTIENVTIDGGSENGRKSTTKGGIIYLTGGTQVYLNQNATLCNSNTPGNNGAGIRMEGNNSSKLFINGAVIRNCVCTGYGGAISGKNGDITMNSGLITECSAAYGAGIVVERRMDMSGGEIIGNKATAEGGGINIRPGGSVHFSGNPVISGNTLNGVPCNLHLINDNNTSIYADGLGPFAEIRVYTAGNVKANHGEDGDPFGTWTDNANLYCFINDRAPALRGMKTIDNKLIYWRANPILSVGKFVDSDWSVDKEVEFEFTVTLSGQELFTDGNSIHAYGDMEFNDDGVATVRLKAGEVKTAVGLPFEFIHDGVNYTVTENLPEGQTAYTTQYQHNGGDSVSGTTVTGHFGENMNDDPLLSSSLSRVVFTNTRAKDNLLVSKTVEEQITGDTVMPYAFTLTLDDNTITKSYDVKRYLAQDQNETVTEDTLSFTAGVATFQLIHGQTIEIKGLPKDLGFTVEEELTGEQKDNFRAYVKADSAERILSYSSAGRVGELRHVAFINIRYGLVCKIVNDTTGREQLYFRENNDPKADPVPAIFDKLELAFLTIGNGTELFTNDGASADVKLRVEMVRQRYTMEEPATLAAGYKVTLGTAKKTDRLYPYPSDADMPSQVNRGFAGSSMFVDNGNLTIDNITLDGNAEAFFGEMGGIVQVNGAQTLTVTENATLRNSRATGNGGAIWIGETGGLVMNGAIEACAAVNGGGVYAANGFGGGMTGDVGMTVGGSVTGCTATAGNGGALYVGTAAEGALSSILGDISLTLTGAAALNGNRATAVEGIENSGRGGAIYSASDAKIDSAGVSVTGNTASNDGGGIFFDAGTAFAMAGGIVSDNVAETGSGGGIWAQSIQIGGGTLARNRAANGSGGAVYTNEAATVTIEGDNTSFEGNEARLGGAVYAQAASFSMAAGAMTRNTATETGGAVYVAGGHSFAMSGGSISGNRSPKGAVSTGEGAELHFSGGAAVSGNTASDEATAMNVYLGYHSNTVIHASDLIGNAPIGVYVADGDAMSVYHNHGIAGRPFGTFAAEHGENLGKFVNDRDTGLTGAAGANNRIMWPGKNLELQVCRNKADAEGQRNTPVGGAQFSLAVEGNDGSVTLWTGVSNATTGFVTIPWGTVEQENGGTAAFMKLDANESVIPATYVLSQQQSDEDTVLPAGTWRLTVDVNNTVTWTVIEPVADGVNRTLGVEAESETPYLGDIFHVYNDVEPTITFDPNGGILHGGIDTASRVDPVPFTTTELNTAYTVAESNPTRSNAVFRAWSTVKDPTPGDGHLEFRQGELIPFYRQTDNDDLTLYALWETVVCKITDREDNLLYVNGGPAVYITLKAGFDAFNDASFTLIDGTGATPRKIKMLVGSYEMTTAVELARGKIAEFMTAPNSDTDGYTGPKDTCVITRAPSFDSGSMIVNNYTLAIRNLTLDGAAKTIEGNGGIVTVQGNAAHLTLAQKATLRNSTVTGMGGAVYAYGNTYVTVSDGSSITDCQAAQGGAIYADDLLEKGGTERESGVVNLSGGTISDNRAEGSGGGVYATGDVNMTGGALEDNTANTNGGGLYLAPKAEFSMRGGSIAENTANTNGGGVYSDGAVTLRHADAVIRENEAGESGGGVYVSADGSFALSAGSVGEDNAPNKAVYGGGVYLAGSATLTGGSISYNAANNGEGGGLYLSAQSDLTLGGTELSHNRAGDGGAIYAKLAVDADDVTLTLAKGTISNNTATDRGGGVYLADGGGNRLTFRMTGGTLGSGNTADYGGGIYAAGAVELNGGSLSSNTASADGGGAYIASGGSLSIADNSGGRLRVTGNSAVNGGAVCADGTVHLESGSISGNSASANGGAVYLKDNAALHVSGGTISENSASGASGGAINIEGANARVYLSGSPSIFNNPGNAATTAQRNLVLSEDSNAVINTENAGLTGGTVGVYVIPAQELTHGVYNTPFGTFGDADTNRENAKYLVNDRDLALYGVTKGGEDGTIYWLNVVCKLTDTGDALLYKLITVNGTTTTAYVSAVYDTVEKGFAALGSSLYRRPGSRYAIDNHGSVRLKLLQDYTLDETEIISYSGTRSIRLTTAETQRTPDMRANDTYFFIPSAFAEGEKLTKATLTRGQTGASMFTVNLTDRDFDVYNLILDGGSAALTADGVDGGAFNIVSVASSTFEGVILQNLNATGDGGAICLRSGALALRESVITGTTATNGGAILASGTATVAMHGGTINGNTAAINGAGVCLTENAALSLSGGVSFGGTGAENDALVAAYSDGGAAGNFVRRDAASFQTGENEPVNGGKAYPWNGEAYLIRQDIYVPGAAEPNLALRVADAVTADPGTIWVWAEHQNHYEKLRQFAVFEGDGMRLPPAQKETSMKAFRNARPDEQTVCVGEYLTGQSGEKLQWIYWTGGYDVVFLKADGNGAGLPGATFMLYTDEGCTVPYEMLPTGVTSSDGTAAFQNRDGKTATLLPGEVLLPKVPPRTFYLKETEAPQGYLLDETVYQVVISDTGEMTMTKSGASETEVLRMTLPAMEVDGETASLTQYVIVNVTEAQRKVILRKIDGENNPLQGAVFEIFRYDGSPLSSGTDAMGNPITLFSSDANGVYFVGTLSYGTYYLHEITAPYGYSGDQWFTLTVKGDETAGRRDGITVSEQLGSDPRTP